MKTKIILIILSMISFKSKASDPDTAIFKRITAEEAVSMIASNDRQSHSQFKTGTQSLILGTVLTVTGSFINTNPEDVPIIQPVMIVSGSIALLTGIVMMIDSHKFTGRNGRIQMSKEGLILKIGKR